MAGENGILAMYCIPRLAYTGGNWDTTHPWLAKNVAIDTPAIYPQTVPKPAVTDTLNGYLPKTTNCTLIRFAILRCIIAVVAITSIDMSILRPITLFLGCRPVAPLRTKVYIAHRKIIGALRSTGKVA